LICFWRSFLISIFSNSFSYNHSLIVSKSSYSILISLEWILISYNKLGAILTPPTELQSAGVIPPSKFCSSYISSFSFFANNFIMFSLLSHLVILLLWDLKEDFHLSTYFGGEVSLSARSVCSPTGVSYTISSFSSDLSSDWDSIKGSCS